MTASLDPVLVPMGFAPGQVGTGRADAQVIYCRGLIDSLDGACVDLVLDLRKQPTWRITAVRYDGFPSERMHLDVPPAPELDLQLDQLAGSIADDLRWD